MSKSTWQIPLLVLFKSSSTYLGSITVYRTSVQSIICASRSLVTTTKMGFQGIFLMSAFCASLKLKPRLEPRDEDAVDYIRQPGGVSLDVKCV